VNSRLDITDSDLPDTVKVSADCSPSKQLLLNLPDREPTPLRLVLKHRQLKAKNEQ
jgi:hypothetical protein